MKIFSLILASLLLTLAISAWFAGRTTDLRERKELKVRADQIDLALRQMR